MKTKKNIYITLIVIFAISTLSFGFKSIFKTHSFSPPPLTPQEEILGVWIMEDEPENKIEFLTDGHVKTYVNNVLESDNTYSITNECGGLTHNPNQLFLSEIDGEDGDEYCFYIEGINSDDGGLLSLMDDSGRMIIYARQ
jgi:hypothetical protein